MHEFFNIYTETTRKRKTKKSADLAELVQEKKPIIKWQIHRVSQSDTKQP